MDPLKKRIGILGGGQLGRMFIEEALRLNLHVNILDPDKNCSCHALANTFIQGSLYDEQAIRQLASISDVISYEIEHVNTQVLLALEEEGATIIPSPRILQLIQDKGLQKQFYEQHRIPTSRFFLVESKEQWKQAIEKLGTHKIVAKTRRDGYDGKGVAILNMHDILADPTTIPFTTPCVIEEFITCRKELAVIVARDQQGNTTCYPSIEMQFDPVANLVTLLVSPAEIEPAVEQEAEAIAHRLVDAFGGPGLFAVEMFLDENNRIFVNEVAPRPHNSGHHSIEACFTSQFEQLARILLNLPLGSTRMTDAAGMLNILGDPGFSGAYRFMNMEEVSAIEGVYIHLYAKAESRPMRKMGHVTLLGSTQAEVMQKAQRVRALLTMAPAASAV